MGISSLAKKPSSSQKGFRFRSLTVVKEKLGQFCPHLATGHGPRTVYSFSVIKTFVYICNCHIKTWTTQPTYSAISRNAWV